MKKPYNRGILPLVILGLLALQPSTVVAIDAKDKGKIDYQTDRIGQDQKSRQDDQNLRETELDKTAPGLFSEQTQEAVKQKQENKEKTEERIKKQAIDQGNPADESKHQLKDSLFTKTVQTNDSAFGNGSQKQTEEEGISFSFLLSVLASVFIFIVGVFLIVRKTKDERK
ncbi:hypothetical protein A374_18821 [Fictibacillus macauensis ZFHKF-1]|uniref:Uncharacterized protein n=1 Tax=Fictibacillus macauensis ZFHKF-1 TaxID=1196324 RepID=I8ADV2_9BACL|nr:type VII secretion protein EssA [Fictibacillus macauensis]EIT83772.1 hypothetical protein A374_18821 [Fictibacillus macauensis ZFHKF-1]